MTTTDPAVQKLAPPPKKPGRTFKASVMSADEPIYRKVLAIGRSGFGKTMAIAGIVESGHRVMVFDTDIGGNGLSTVQETLKSNGHSDLLKNIAWFEFGEYKDLTYVLDHPSSLEVDGKSLWDWDPDVLVWEGLSNFQECSVTQYALDLAPMRGAGNSNVTEARQEGLWAEQVDWGVIRRATLFAVDKFLRLHNPNGKKVHKYVTVLQDAGKEDKFGDVKKGPLIMGAAREYLAPAFDLILTLQVTPNPANKKQLNYSYKCDVSDQGYMSKKRALPIDPVEPANMKVLWSKITAQ